MAKKPTKSALKFDIRVKVEVTVPEFQPLASTRALDLKRLSKGNHKVEVGFLKGGCCPTMVRAVIRNGMVTALEVEQCKETKKASSDLSAVLKEARRRLQPRGGKWQPVAVGEFMRDSARFIIIGGGCIFICIWGHCLLCCARDGGFHCSTGDIATGPLNASKF